VTSGMDVVRKLVDHRNNSQPDIIRRVTVK
jgi:hypothetical protein